MIEKRTFRVVLVHQNHGVGINGEERADKTVQYSGQQVSITP